MLSRTLTLCCKLLVSLCLPLGVLPGILHAAVGRISADTGECQPETPQSETVLRTDTFALPKSTLKAYAELAWRRSSPKSAQAACRVTLRLFVAPDDKNYKMVRQLEDSTSEGQIEGIDFIGLSPDGAWLATDLWGAEGDGDWHHPVLYNRLTGQTLDRALGGVIQKRIHSCDSNEDFVAVTNSGQAVFAVPPSDYVDSPECGDQGLWHFNLRTGRVLRVARKSGVKWQR